MKNPKQNCNNCRYAFKCYFEKTSPNNVVINILACRIRMGINRNESSKLLLKMIRPTLIKLASNARTRVGSGYINMDDLLLDLESRVIECLLDEENGYRIGESAYLTEYLFGTNPRTGWVKKWILWDFSKHQRFYKKHILVGDKLKTDEDDEKTIETIVSTEEQSLDENSDDAIKKIKGIIEDGVTLNANEYRVISFCMKHANESNKNRLIDGTHTYLSKVMDVSRPRITKLYAVGRKKLVIAAQQQNIEL